MVALSPAFLTLAVFCSSALAAPWPVATRQHTHRIRSLPNGLRVKTYQPQGTYKTFSDGIDPPIVAGNSLTSSFKDSAMAFINKELGEDQVQFVSSNEGQFGKHVYTNQRINGIKVANAVAHSSLNKKGKVVAFSSNFVTPQNQPPKEAKITKEAALAAAKKHAGATPLPGRDVDLEYFALDDGSVALSHVVHAHVDGNGHLVDIFIDATTGEVAGLLDYTTSLTYHALPASKQSPEQGFEDIVDPEDKEASPQGWTTVNGKDAQSTHGNNVIVFKGDQDSQTSAGAFNTQWEANSDPSQASQVDVARTNAFYIVNKLHDVTYRYGFTEKAFNFQSDNFGKGGEGNDAVTVSVQDSNGVNNADFTTPADGEPGRMRMYLWDITNPMRDGALENDIVVHEFTHGITNRLTGGGTGRCLGSDEAGGMGEGWSDAMAFWMEQTSGEVKDYTMGSYVVNNPAGIRSHPYSVSQEVNPYTYTTLKEKHEVHDIGEVWANMLINVYAGLVEASGFDADAQTNPDSTKGNAIWLHLFIDSLAIQPCNPTFLTARDAWIQADKNRYDGANACTLWKAFASRGLGAGATSDRVDNSDVPDGVCDGSAPPQQDPAPQDPAPQDPAPQDPAPQDPAPQDPAPEPSSDPTEPMPEPTYNPMPPSEDPVPEPTSTPLPPKDPQQPQLPQVPGWPFPTQSPGGDDGGNGDGKPECPLLGWPKRPQWWPFKWC